MNLLYLSCHSILEYDELKLFDELGVNYFSLGSYIDPANPVDQIRPAIKSPGWVMDEQFKAWYDHTPDRDKLPAEFLAGFDAVMVMHVPEWIWHNWDVLRGKRVIWRTIGQCTPAQEEKMRPYKERGVQIVRYSPREGLLQNYAGHDQIIRFYKDEAEFGPWKGDTNEVITFAQDMAHRGEYCNYAAFTQIVQGFNAHVYGPKNDQSGDLNGGFLTYEAMRDKMRHARAYIYTGTQPACYTLNFIEAMLTGIPMVCIGPGLGNSLRIAGDMYEIHEIIKNGYNGFISDNIANLREYINVLLTKPVVAEQISKNGRDTALKLFGKNIIKKQWRQFLYECNKTTY